jgi:hypothetical protein
MVCAQGPGVVLRDCRASDHSAGLPKICWMAQSQHHVEYGHPSALAADDTLITSLALPGQQR